MNHHRTMPFTSVVTAHESGYVIIRHSIVLFIWKYV